MTIRPRAERKQQPSTARRLVERTAAAPVDYPLVATLATLLAIGLVSVYTATYYSHGSTYFMQHARWIVLGLAGMIVMTVVPHEIWRKVAVPVLALAIVMLIGILIIGFDQHGARRTLDGGKQPSEFAKIAVAIYVSAWVASKKEQMARVGAGLIPFAIYMGIVASLILMEPSFSVTIIVLTIGLTIFFVGGGDVKQILFTGMIVVLVFLVLFRLKQYGFERLELWWAGLADPNQSSYDVARSIALLRRGATLNMVESEVWQQKQTLGPLLYTDYIFVNIGHDMGFFGMLGVVVLYAILGYRGLSIASSAPTQFGSLLATGITAWFLCQATIAMGAPINLLPQTGVPLPFISYGGSAMLSSLLGAGLLLSISRAAREEIALCAL